VIYDKRQFYCILNILDIWLLVKGSPTSEITPTITLLLCVHTTYIWVQFFAHIPLVVNQAFNVTPRGGNKQCTAKFLHKLDFCWIRIN